MATSSDAPITQKTAEARIAQAKKAKSPLLDLLGLGLRNIPDSVRELPHLRMLQLSYNLLTDLPQFICDFTELEELDLSGNKLSILPQCLGDLHELRVLDISGNEIPELPATFCTDGCIERLDMSSNDIGSLPGWLFNLSNLRHLNISNNKLKTISSNISRLSSLKTLDLSRNAVGHIPSTISALIGLESLAISGCSLSTFPEDICKLAHLCKLDISNNAISHIPDELRNLSNLASLMLHGNPKLRLPKQILGPEPHGPLFAERIVGAQQILDYYFEARRDSKVLNESRLILIGRGNSGKTSIVERLVKNKFNPLQQRTDGIAIHSWTPPDTPGRPQLSIWDFGGQEMMHATHQFFLTENSLFLLVLNGREGQEDYDAAYWLQLVNSLAGNSPVVVVQNKMLEQDFELNYRGLMAQYPQIVGFCKTDCSNGHGIPALHDLIRRAIRERMHYMRDLFPSSWFRIKTKIARMSEDYLSYQRFRELCRSQGIADFDQQDSLARYLHCLGVALNYKDDPRLRETSVLKPRWVTEGIYGILTHPQLSERHGEMFASDLADWLDQTRYPPEKHAFLLELMRKFRLCFAFPDSPNHYLVPELLRKEYPLISHDFTPANALNFEYRYPVLPEGLLPQFIVRTHTLSQGPDNCRWRTGVVLTWDDARALIEAIATERRLIIRVAGPTTESRRRLLAIIRADFEQIHRQIPSLRVEEKVPLPEFPEEVIDYNELVVLERNGEKELTKVVRAIGKEIVVKPRVSDLLNGVDFGGARSRLGAGERRIRGARLFISYSHKDEPLKKELEYHLKLLERLGILSSWSDRYLTPGDEWDAVIDRNLEAANVIVLLVSVAFISSNYCYDKEMMRALERHSKGEAVVIPVILRPLNWTAAPFARLAALPHNGVPVTLWKPRDRAWADVADGIEKAVKALHLNPE